MKLVKVNIIFKIRNIWCKKYLKRIQFRLHKHIFYFCKLFSFLHFNSTIFFYLKKIFVSHPSFFFHFQLFFFFHFPPFPSFPNFIFTPIFFFLLLTFCFPFQLFFYFRFRCINFHLCFTTHYFCFLTYEKTDLGDSWTCKKHEKTGNSTILVFSCLPRLWKLYMVTLFVFPH